MTISIKFSGNGNECETKFVGVATVSENPPHLNLLVTDPVWTELQETLGGSMILALTMEGAEGTGVNESILYLKDEDGRERIKSYEFSKGYPSSDTSRVEAQVQTTLLKSEQKRKEKPAEWKWSGNRHGH